MCSNTNAASGATCTDDGIFCNGVEACNGAGACVGSGDPCFGGAECSNVCNEVSDFCFTPAGTTCSIGICDGAGVCTLDTGVCGDGTRNGVEACEGADLGGNTCADISGFTGGTLDCTTSCEFDTSACTTSDTEQTTGSVEILETCGLQFVAGTPINYGGILPGAESLEQQLELDNTGNTALTTLFVRGTNWVDSGGVTIMDVSDSRFSTSSIPYASKIVLGLTDKTVTSAFDPIANLITFWQLTANLLESSFAGDLTQTLDFTVSC